MLTTLNACIPVCIGRPVKAQTTSLFAETYNTPKLRGTSLEIMPDACATLTKTVQGTKRESHITQPRESSLWSEQKGRPTVCLSPPKGSQETFRASARKRSRGAPSQTKPGESLGQ